MDGVRRYTPTGRSRLHISEQAVDGAAGPGEQSRALFTGNKAPIRAMLNEQVRGAEKTLWERLDG